MMLVCPVAYIQTYVTNLTLNNHVAINNDCFLETDLLGQLNTK